MDGPLAVHGLSRDLSTLFNCVVLLFFVDKLGTGEHTVKVKNDQKQSINFCVKRHSHSSKDDKFYQLAQWVCLFTLQFNNLIKYYMDKIIDKRHHAEHLEIFFETEGKFSNEEIAEILDDIRIIIEQRQGIKKLTIIKS